MKKLSEQPIVLDFPRAWRTYTGGALLDQLHGMSSEDCKDTNFPEEWVMSVVEARNAGREDFKGEGLSHLSSDPSRTLKDILTSDPAGFLGKAAAKLGPQPGVLVKLIDSAERLTIQVHPDRETARSLFNSEYGKTECWHILGSRIIDGEDPCVYIGFREGIAREKWQNLFQKQDTEGMLGCLHRFAVKPGDTFLIEGGVPHAIGAGCFLTEIQEPTDYTIRVERITPRGLRVADSMCHQGLGFEKMFDCFHYEGITGEEALRRWYIPSAEMVENDCTVRSLIGYERTAFFALREILVPSDKVLSMLHEQYSGYYVLKGSGVLISDTGESVNSIALKGPEQIFMPAGIKKITLRADEDLRILEFRGPQIV